MAKRAKLKPSWFVYIALCANDTFYTGITTDIKRRFQEHVSSRGARYTRSFKPIRLLWKEPHPERSSALKREAQIKSWSRPQKEAFIYGRAL
ncbi:MAG: GIY-YIG nuclease family protein [Elusimicrobia bacterium]|nr:GIY-YIG nuclease family protein [Elusimicrobiota bacterium]